MQHIISTTEILRLSTGELHALIKNLQSQLQNMNIDHKVRLRLEVALRSARVEFSQRQARFAPKPPGF